VNITTLIENSKGRPGLAKEWGLSLFIEANGLNILFDTGATSAFVKNAHRLGLDLGKVDMAVLSHGHYDHGGGLAGFFSENERAPLYLRATADDRFYHKALLFKIYIGLDAKTLRANGARLRWVKEDTEVAPGVFVLTSIPSSETRPHTENSLTVRTERGLVPDRFEHELVLVVKEKDGISVITGCGHRGVANMVLAASRKFPQTPIKAVIGGFHLTGKPLFGPPPVSEDDTRKIARRLEELGCQRVISGHCTGKKASDILRMELKGRFSQLATGLIIET
jgi:7,8-dihydropterin-6-yl-methyl-4-(beta-D-ribofuranosyl)aminobenzene 5'-phosphate synthase